MTDLPKVMRGLVARPGDTILIAVADDRWTLREMDEFRTEIRAGLGPEVKVAVLCGVAQIAVYRPDPMGRAGRRRRRMIGRWYDALDWLEGKWERLVCKLARRHGGACRGRLDHIVNGSIIDPDRWY